MLAAPSSMAESLPTELLSPLRLEDTDTGGWVRNNPASSGLPNHISIASVLHPNTTAAQGWQITNAEIHLRDKPLLFWYISALASVPDLFHLKTHHMISYSRNNRVFLVVTRFFTWLASHPKTPPDLCRRVRSGSCQLTSLTALFLVNMSQCPPMSALSQFLQVILFLIQFFVATLRGCCNSTG